MFRNGCKSFVRDHTSRVAPMEMEDEPDQCIFEILQASSTLRKPENTPKKIEPASRSVKIAITASTCQR